MAELRALQRVCEARCERQAPELVAQGRGPEEIAREASACMDTCVEEARRTGRP